MGKIKNYLFEILIAGSILIFTTNYFDLYSRSDLAVRPFNAEVWGTFADWGMIIVTAFTAIYLVKTFREQKKAGEIQQKVLIEQQKITKIAQEEFRYSILPEVKVEFNAETKILSITVINKRLNNCIIKFTSMNSLVKLDTNANRKIPSNYLKGIHQVLWLKDIDGVQLLNLNSQSLVLGIYLEYFDEIGNKYKATTYLNKYLKVNEVDIVKVA